MANPHKHWLVEQLESNAWFARGPVATLWRYLSRDLWLRKVEREPLWRRFWMRTGRVMYLTVRSFVVDRCVLQAGALTYVTVLSLVPLLAFAFAMLKGLGYYEELREHRIDPFFDELLGARASVEAQSTAAADVVEQIGVAEPLPARGAFELRDGIDQVLDLVDQTNLKGLGFIGLIVLLLAVVRLLGSIEDSFNRIWGVRKARSWVRKLADYLTIVVVTPIFLVVAIGVTTSAQNAGVTEFLRQELALGGLIELLLRGVPVLVGWFAFTIVYLVMPNRRCKLSSALIGGFVAGTLWQIALVLHIRFQVGIANYNAIYAGFAALPVFLVWVQTSWVIVLLGAEVAYAHESEPDYRGLAAHQQHHQAFTEQIALRALTRVCDAFLAGEKPPSSSDIAAALGLAPRELREVLEDLREGGLVTVVEGRGDEARAFVPARDPERITVVDVLGVMRGEGLDLKVAAVGELDTRVDKLLTQLQHEARSSAFNRSLRELVDEARRREVAAGKAKLAQQGVQPS